MCGRTRVAGVLRKLQRGLNSQDRQSNRNTKDSGEAKKGGTQSYTFVLSNNMKMGRGGASANAIEDVDKCKHLENMTPGHYSLVLKMDVSGKSVGKAPTLQLQAMRWGLFPSFSPDRSKDDPFRMFNSRIDRVTILPVFSRLVHKKRCIVLIDGFYEFKTLSNKQKQPYYITTKNESEPLMLAGIYDEWRPKEDVQRNGEESLTSYSILTMEACNSISWLHHRMPVLLSREAAAVWLDVENVSAEEAKSFIWKNCKEPKFITRAVTNKINKATYQKPDCSLDIDKSKSSLKHFFGKKKPSVKNEASQKHSEQFEPKKIKAEIKHEVKALPIQIQGFQKKRVREEMVQYALKSTPKKIYSTHEKTGKRSKKSSPATKGQKSLTMFFKKKKTHTHTR
eukprot:g8628.t1